MWAAVSKALTAAVAEADPSGSTATVRSVHPAPVRCGIRLGSEADEHGLAAAFSARVIRAALYLASRCANIHCMTGAVAVSGSSRYAAPQVRVRLVRVQPRIA